MRGLRIWQITNSDRLTENDLLERLQRTQHNSVTKNYECTREIQYSMGLLVNEKLFYDFGDAKVNELWLAINQPSSLTRSAWEVAFSDTFGMTAEDWYTTSAIPYLLGVFED